MDFVVNMKLLADSKSHLTNHICQIIFAFAQMHCKMVPSLLNSGLATGIH